MNEQMAKLLRPSIIVPVAVGVASFAVGTGFGYILGRRKKIEVHELPKKLDLGLDVKELPEPRIEKTTVIIEEEPVEEEPLIQGRGEDIATPAEMFILQHLPDTMVVEEEPEEERRVIFAGPSITPWDYEVEVANRTTERPYVIHKDEFYAEEMDYAQSTLTYFASDDIMVDQEEAPIYNYSAVVGPLLFGHGCDDPNVFHVRNDARRAEYEIIYDPGFYGVEILGLELEEIQDNKMIQDLKHNRPPKMRPEQ